MLIQKTKGGNKQKIDHNIFFTDIFSFYCFSIIDSFLDLLVFENLSFFGGRGEVLRVSEN